jgi:hypothetical protein
VSSRALTVAVAGCYAVALVITGCGADKRPPGGERSQWVSPPTSSASQAPSARARLKEITSACKLLPADVVVDLLGGSATSKLTAMEDPVEHLDKGRIRHGCTYGQKANRPFGLIVSSRPNRAADAAAAIEAIAKASGVKTTPIKGLGAGGVGYVTDGLRLVAVAVTYKDELRLVIFSAPQIVPHAKLVEVANHVVVQV